MISSVVFMIFRKISAGCIAVELFFFHKFESKQNTRRRYPVCRTYRLYRAPYCGCWKPLCASGGDRGGSDCALPCVRTSRLPSDPIPVCSLTQCLKQHHRSPNQCYSILCGEIHQPWLKQQMVSMLKPMHWWWMDWWTFDKCILSYRAHVVPVLSVVLL